MSTGNDSAQRDWSEVQSLGIALLERGDHKGAIDALKDLVLEDPGGEARALLALAYFRDEEYGLAAEHYQAALLGEPGRDDWRDMLTRARANESSEINVQVPEPSFFDRDELLAEAVVPEGKLPTPPSPLRVTPLRKLRRLLGGLLGAGATPAMGIVTQLVGRLGGYRDEVWTNWYRRGPVFGILTLAYMREHLNKHNLKTTYPRGALVGFQPSGKSPPRGATHFRTADGSWNNFADPKEGAAGTRFPRNVNDTVIEPETGDALMTPNPREVSRKLLTRKGEMAEVPFLNLLAACWIQFENHDWISHSENLSNEVHEIPLAEDDPAREKYRQLKMVVAKTQRDPTRIDDGEHTPITFINEVTHWWDGSQIYGSDQATVDRLRSGVDGKLRLADDDTLVLDDHGIEETGFTRNWWVGLALLHTLFTREHNAICDALKTSNPDWDDNRLFNVARLINAAVMAKIHSVEWTPAILPNHTLSSALHANWYGLLTNLFKTGRNRKTKADINVRNPEMGGVVGNPIDKHGEPYGLTEEFVEIYRLHSLLPETLKIRRMGDGANIEEIPFVESRQAGSAKVTKRFGLTELLYSFGNQNPGQLILNNFPRFMQELSIPGNPLFDLGAVDILRARERGVPRYNEFRRQLGLNPIRTFEDLSSEEADAEPLDVNALKEVYGRDPEAVERLDLMIGTLAEGNRPTNFGFGETMFQIFILNATRRLQTDRFYTDCYNEETYTAVGLQWVDDADFKTVLLRHYPELRDTGLANVKNAFEPWDPAERLNPERHPLRAFDKELRPDPWVGDAAR